MIGNNGSQSGGRIHVSESVRLSGARRSTAQPCDDAGGWTVASKPLLDLHGRGPACFAEWLGCAAAAMAAVAATG